MQFQSRSRRLQAHGHRAAGGQAAAEPIDQAAQHRLQPQWITEHRWQLRADLEHQFQAPARQLPLPQLLQLPHQGAEVCAGQIGGLQGRWLVAGVFGFALLFSRQEDQPEAVDLLAALAVDMFQTLLHHRRQVLAAQQRADQGADGGQGGAHLVGEGLQQGQLAADGAPLLLALAGAVGTAALDQGLQGQARRHGRQALGQPWPELLSQLWIAVQWAELLQVAAQQLGLLGGLLAQPGIDQSQGRSQHFRFEAHHQPPGFWPPIEAEGHLQARCDQQ